VDGGAAFRRSPGLRRWRSHCRRCLPCRREPQVGESSAGDEFFAYVFHAVEAYQQPRAAGLGFGRHSLAISINLQGAGKRIAAPADRLAFCPGKPVMGKVSAGRKAGRLGWLRGWLGARAKLAPELQRGIELLKAIDAGGIPLNPAIVNRIARNLGLEVSASAPVEETIARIRAAVERAQQAAEAEGALRQKLGPSGEDR